jgi:hypothetical protein
LQLVTLFELTVNVMTALYQAGVTDLIDQILQNIRRGSHH